jgi:hypothetical protein
MVETLTGVFVLLLGIAVGAMSFFTESFRRCMTASSHSSDPERLPECMDMMGFGQCFKVFVASCVLPTVAAPLAALHAFGLYRCGRTICAPYSVPQPMFLADDVQVVVHRRKYDRDRKRIVEEGCFFDSPTIEKGMKVAGSRRDEFVDDPAEPGVSYFVMERRKMNRKYMIQGQCWVYGAMDDFVMYGAPLFICAGFIKPARQFHHDIFLWLRGRLRFVQIRHPVANFFLGINEYNRAKMRKSTTKKIVKPMLKPWNYKE